MDRETDRIKQHIDSERDRLGSNLHEIEDRLKNAADWKVWFAQHPGLMLGTAVAGGLILSQIVGKASPNASPNYQADRSREKRPILERIDSISPHMHPISETLDSTFAALVGLVSGKFQDFIADSIPGFREQYDKIDRKKA